MITKTIFRLIILFSAVSLISCENTETISTDAQEETTNEETTSEEITQETTENNQLDISGVYRRFKKVDMANNEETIYEKESPFYTIGYDISNVDGTFMVNRTDIAEDNSSVISEHSKPMSLEQTDDEIYQFKPENGVVVFTYYFSATGIEIAEFATKQGFVAI